MEESKQPVANDNNTEFRNVKAAENCLQLYIESGRNIGIIRSVPISKIARIDVWLCVFEKEPEAYAALQVKELYALCFENKKEEGEIKNDQARSAITKLQAEIFLAKLEPIVEFKLPLKLEEALAIIRDGMGEEFLSVLLKIAEKHLERRKIIASRYVNSDTKWIAVSEIIVEKIKKLIV